MTSKIDKQNIKITSSIQITNLDTKDVILRKSLDKQLSRKLVNLKAKRQK